MTEDDLFIHAYGFDIFKKWHWFRFHFEQHLRGGSHPFARSIVQACLSCECHLPGFAARMIDAIAALAGREKDHKQYEQLLQRLAELLVIRQVVTYPWPFTPRFRWEPTPAGSKKSPELLVEGGPCPFGIEVKAPSLLEHIALREKNSTQVPSRSMPREQIDKLPGVEQGVTLPRDNPVKDFLISAEAKFAPFRRANPEFRGVLVIVWDDFIYEPISSLIHPECGLLTRKSFATGPGGQPLTFPSVDAVVLIRHLHQFQQAAGDKPLVDQCREALDYGRDGDFPPKAIIGNPFAGSVPMVVVKCLQAYTPSPEMGAEYLPSDLVWWMGD
jgi:hypothetical protein